MSKINPQKMPETTNGSAMEKIKCSIQGRHIRKFLRPPPDIIEEKGYFIFDTTFCLQLK